MGLFSIWLLIMSVRSCLSWSLRRKLHQCHTSKSVYDLFIFFFRGRTTAGGNNLVKAFCGSRGSFVKSDKLAQVMTARRPVLTREKNTWN